MKTQLQIFNYTVHNQNTDSVDVHIDGDIVDSPTKELLDKFWGDQTSVSFKSFRDQVPAGVKTLNVYTNSLGGHVGDAMAIHDYLKSLESKGVTVNRIGRGIIASAGTYILMGKNSEMSENSWFMIHNVSGTASGTVDQVENQAKAMRKFNDRIVKFYADHTGLSQSTISSMMNAETWLNAQEAKDKGFIQKVSSAATFSNSIRAQAWPYQNKVVLNAYNSFAGKTPQPVKKPTNRFSGAYQWKDEKGAPLSNQSSKPPRNRFSGAYKPFEE